ncbi:MAG: RNA polymerase subunit sigma [Legionella sp. 40-6]|nr:sigma-70 family RNA polymerase sigma factor [Legionella sp.]OJY39325.1 MAG: RNA polymerase subunit sigma [Legionella sp. 40-6]
MRERAWQSDEDLVFRAQKGDKQACEELLARYYHKIKKIVYYQLFDPSVAGDIVQEVLLKTFRYLHHFKQQSLFSTWVYRITHNTIKNHYRSCSVLEQEDGPIHEVASSSQSPEFVVINLELGERLEMALSLLAEDLRVCLIMYLVEGESYESIARKVDCPVGTVRSRIFRARQLLFAAIKD